MSEPTITPTLPLIENSFTIQTRKGTSDAGARSFCLEPNKLISGQPITIQVCNGSDAQSWRRGSKGQFQNNAKPFLCLKNIKRKLKIASCVDENDVRFGYDWFDSTLAMKKKPFLVATAHANVLKENLIVTLEARSEGNDMQEFDLVPNNGGLFPAPPEKVIFQSKIIEGD